MLVVEVGAGLEVVRGGADVVDGFVVLGGPWVEGLGLVVDVRVVEGCVVGGAAVVDTTAAWIAREVEEGDGVVAVLVGGVLVVLGRSVVVLVWCAVDLVVLRLDRDDG